MMQYLIVLTIAGILYLEFGITLSLEVTGRFTCNGQPKSVDAHLAIVEEVGSGNSGDDGELRIQSVGKLTSKAKLFVYYKCTHVGMCYERLEIDIPTEQETFDFGTVNLNQPNQSFVRTVCGPWGW
ncbi:unnamed protein product [Cylicocyclus nassatus]|uniref:Transthyretin-like family protein n=1 Tax=Cylicocyclus nassatus TaxID=53992 RepID=A0AA36H7V5_CYLNA|nr:unnamed protein product [Cylicocyclus nassatus]